MRTSSQRTGVERTEFKKIQTLSREKTGIPTPQDRRVYYGGASFQSYTVCICTTREGLTFLPRGKLASDCGLKEIEANMLGES